jgi:hypothetical protein
VVCPLGKKCLDGASLVGSYLAGILSLDFTACARTEISTTNLAPNSFLNVEGDLVEALAKPRPSHPGPMSGLTW